MELSQDILIEVGLNALGYIIVSIFSIMVYSMFKRQNKTITNAENKLAINEINSDKGKILKNKNVSDNVNFISFDTSRNANNIANEEAKNNTARRDRSQIIRIAREMIKAGANEKKIMSLLPISEAELAILNMTNK
ncbi:MAG: hypothetical protein DRP35_01090 [Candidatus Zixiibacteriota bacterium]|nr:MAG: hypothetical protein DRP35_01090 [candidate division Zixibacteria bacterium]